MGHGPGGFPARAVVFVVLRSILVRRLFVVPGSPQLAGRRGWFRPKPAPGGTPPMAGGGDAASC